MIELIEKLEQTHALSRKEWVSLIECQDKDIDEMLFEKARVIRHLHYGHDIYIRGLIEFTNYCRNDCFYCGIRKSNRKAERYRLTDEEILSCCENGYALGMRTFVLQGGEDPYFTDEKLVSLIKQIKQSYPDCALTLSIGEKRKESYQAYFDAGADRFLLRHETADDDHFAKLHPPYQTLKSRKSCLFFLRDIGYQTGSGFMVGSPFQTAENLADDMLFLKELNPHMIGIGPFIPHRDTPFAGEKPGTPDLTVRLLAMLRLMLPKVLLPSTTALGTIASDGRKKGILAGGNVIMPNLSPLSERAKYSLYNGKRYTDQEAAEGLEILKEEMRSIGYRVVCSRGDSLVTD